MHSVRKIMIISIRGGSRFVIALPLDRSHVLHRQLQYIIRSTIDSLRQYICWQINYNLYVFCVFLDQSGRLLVSCNLRNYGGCWEILSSYYFRIRETRVFYDDDTVIRTTSVNWNIRDMEWKLTGNLNISSNRDSGTRPFFGRISIKISFRSEQE